MAEPIVFITSLEINDGQLEEFKAAVERSMAFMEANAPNLFAGVYLDEDSGTANGVQVHRDSESILSMWRMNDPNIREVMQHARTAQVEIYGEPSEEVMEGMRRLAGSGVTLVLKPRLAGFMRLGAVA